VRLSVGAVNVRTGNFTYFDSAKKPLRAEHIMASAALPPGFPAVEIEGEFYWDGGVVSNTPLEFVFDEQKRSDTLAFQVDLWSAQGALPQTIADVLMRQKDIQYSSRTRRGTDEIRRRQHTRCQVAKLLDKLDGELRNDALVASLREWSKSSLYNVVHLIYQSKSYEGDAKDYQFGVTSMLEHWRAGLTDIDITLRRRDYFALPSTDTGITTHDIHRNGGR
jgi:NTE family protein